MATHATGLALTETDERRQLSKFLAGYRATDEDAWRALAVTGLLYSAGVFFLHVSHGNAAAVLFLALCHMRIFMTFHDAGHHSFFPGVESNKRLGRVAQFFASYSFDEWNEIHNAHHKHFGDPTIPDKSMTIFFSEAELRKNWALMVVHRIIHEPLLFYPLAGLFVFFLNKPHVHFLYRIPVPLLVWLFLGTQTLWAYMASAVLAGILGVALFHLQHSCNMPYRVKPPHRSFLDAAMLGSTRMPVPFPFTKFLLGIQYHHIHHFDIRVPGYRLDACDAAGHKLGFWSRANTVHGWRAFKSLFHTQFKGSRKWADAEGNQPQFVSFWPWSALGLQDA